MLDIRWKPLAVYGVALAIVGVLFLGAQSLRTPVPTEEYQKCLKANQTIAKHQPQQCPTSETIWQKTLSDPVSYYTGWLTLFTLALAAVGFAQGIFTSEQIELARNDFSVTLEHALPKIRLAGVELTEWKDWDVSKLADPKEAALKPRGAVPTFSIHNHGTTNAVISAVATNFAVRAIPPIPSYRVWKLQGGLRIVGGNSGGRFEDSAILTSEEQRANIDSGKWYLWYFGKITVRDFRKNETEIGFIFRYDPKRRDRPFIEDDVTGYTFQREIRQS